MELLETSLQVKGLEHLTCEQKTDRAGTVLPGEKKVLREEPKRVQMPGGVLQSRQSQALVSVAQ